MRTQQKTKPEWKEIGLGEILEFIRNGLNISQFEEGNYPITRIETIWHSKIDTKRVKYCNPSDEQINNYSLKEGDILFSHINSPTHIGKTGIYEGIPKIIIHGINLLLLRPKRTLVYPKYLDYFLKTKNIRKFFEIRCKKAVNQASLNQKAITSIKIPLPFLDGKPDLETQKQIVAVLEKAESLKQKQKRVLELYDEYLKSVFWEMFLKDKENWEEKSLGEVAKLSMGGTPSTIVESYWKDGTINWMKSGDIKGDFIFEIPNKITEEGFKNSNATIYPIGTVVIALNGQGKTRGTTSILKVETTSNQSVVGIMVDKEKIISEYLHFNLKLRYNELRNLTGDDARTGLNLTILRNLKVPLPPLPIQQTFANIVEKVEKLKEKQKKSLEDSEELFNALMQRAFRGELS